MNEGWIKLYRKLVSWEWYTDTPAKCLWLHLLLMANIEPVMYRGKEIPRGSLATTELKLSVELGMSRQQVRTAMNKLISTNEISKHSCKEYTVITVNKYDDYQACASAITNDIYQPSTLAKTITSTTEATTTATTPLLNKKKRRKEYNPPISPLKGGRFVPPTVDEVREYCEERGNGINANDFVDFYQSKGWMVGKNKMKDWKAAVRTWERSRAKEEDTTVPIYDDTGNRDLSDEDLADILKEMRRT